MAVYLSPGVYPREIDLSVLPAAVGPLRPAFVGTAKKGPLNAPVYITSSQQAIDTFGEPFAESYLMYAVLAYLEEGNECYVVRVGIEYESGGDEVLNSVAIATNGSRSYGWGRIPVFSGIDYGRINLRPVSVENPVDIHIADISASTYIGREVTAAADAELTITGPYTGDIDDSYVVVITGSPTNKDVDPIDGATFQIIQNSTGAVVAEDTIVAAGSSSQSIAIPDTGLSLTIDIITGHLTLNDTFTFSVVAKNTILTIDGDDGEDPSNAIADATYTSATALVAAINAAKNSAYYEAVVETIMIDGVATEVPQLRTITEGKRIQLKGSVAFCNAVGVAPLTYDIPRAAIQSTLPGPFNINSANNRVKLDVLSSASGILASTEFTIPVGGSQTAQTIAQAIDAAGIINNVRVFNGIVITGPGNVDNVVIITDLLTSPADSLVLRANYSYVKTLRFAQTLGISYPYKGSYRGYSDPRAVLPTSSLTDSTTPLSCDLYGPADSRCLNDSEYFANIVGYFVATSAGTWVDGYKVSVDIFTDAAGNPTNRYTVTVSDSLNVGVERYADVVFDKTADRYIANFLNPGTKYGGTTGSKFINWEERPAYLNNDPLDTVNYEVRQPSVLIGAGFVGAQNGIPLDPAYSASLDAAIIGRPESNSGIYAFQNSDTYDINLLMTPGVSSGAVIGSSIQLCETRGDVLYIVDPPFGLRPQQVVDWHNGMLLSDLSNAINSSYAALYWGWIKVYDQFNVNEIWVPPSGHISAVFSRTARNTEQWYAAAGVTRGRLLTALELEYTPSTGENDLLYGSGNAVNPIVSFPQNGIVVWGNRTLQRQQSALSSVNVRMLLNYLKKSLTNTLRTYVFEPNDKTLWAQVASTINPFLGDIQSRRGITGFKVVCDETNNTPERIDRGELWVSIFIKPTRSVEYVVLNIAVVNTGANFSSEAVLAAGGIVTAVASV